MSKIAATIAAGVAAATFAIAIPATAGADTGTSAAGATRTSAASAAPEKTRSIARTVEKTPAPAAAHSKIGSLNAKLAGLGINLPK